MSAKRTTGAMGAGRPKVRAVAPLQLTPAESRQLESIAQAHAARMAAEFKDVLEVARNLQRVDPALGRGDAGRLPGGRDLARQTGGDLAHAFRPSSDLSSHMGGAASTATVTKDPETGVVEKTWTGQNADGTTTTRTSAYNPADGSTTSTTTTRQGGNEVHYIRITDRPDGSSEETRASGPDGRVSHTWSRDPAGNMVVDFFQTTDSRGGTRDWDRAEDRRRGLVRLPGENETSALARQLAARFSHGAGAPPPEVTKVNPGDRDDPGPAAPRINPGDSIVVNPAGESAGQAREVSAERAKHWEQQLREKVGGIVNPPGPGRERR